MCFYQPKKNKVVRSANIKRTDFKIAMHCSDSGTLTTIFQYLQNIEEGVEIVSQELRYLISLKTNLVCFSRFHFIKGDILFQGIFDTGSKVGIYYEGSPPGTWCNECSGWWRYLACFVCLNWDAQSLWGNATAPNNKTQLTVTEIIAPMIQLYCCILVLSADRLTYKANLLQQAPRGLSSHLTLLRVCVCGYAFIMSPYVCLIAIAGLFLFPLLCNSLYGFILQGFLKNILDKVSPFQV